MNSNQITGIIDKVANELGIAANQIGPYVKNLYGAYIKQAYITGIQKLIATFICIVFIVISAIILYKSLTKAKKSNIQQETPFSTLSSDTDKTKTSDYDIGVRAITISLIIICTLIAVCSINSAIAAFANPEYWAYTQILDDIKNLVAK